MKNLLLFNTIKNNFLKTSLKCFVSSNLRNTNDILGIKLNAIKDNPGAFKKKRIVGRGPGCTKGKTSGRGHKGQQRSYKPPVHIQGGQTTLSTKLPKFGRSKDRSQMYSELNCEKLFNLIEKNRIDVNQEINTKVLCRAGAVSKLKKGIKLLGKGLHLLENLPPLKIVVASASENVIKAINSKGGEIICQYNTNKHWLEYVKPYRFYSRLQPFIPTYRTIKFYQKLESKGAKVLYNKPTWMLNGQFLDIKKKIEFLKKEVDSMSNTHLLPVYPAPRHKGVNQKGKVTKETKGRKIVFEKQFKSK